MGQLVALRHDPAGSLVIAVQVANAGVEELARASSRPQEQPDGLAPVGRKALQRRLDGPVVDQTLALLALAVDRDRCGGALQAREIGVA